MDRVPFAPVDQLSLRGMAQYEMSKSGPQLHIRVIEITQRIIERSRVTRADYLQRMEAAKQSEAARGGLSCTNLAHGFAASESGD